MTTSNSRFKFSREIVEQYLSFFRARGHFELPGSPLVIPGSSTSFIIAGMQPLLPYLRGVQPAPARRLTSFQRCLRTIDIDRVGTNIRTLTCFQMLGNWSIGDYGKREAIEMAVELLHNAFGLVIADLWVTTFEGDPVQGIASDDYTIGEWQRAGVLQERIVPLGVDDNFWTMGGPGPCGPCTEIFIDRGITFGCGKPTCRSGCECNRFLEIWNLVFIEYESHSDGSLTSLPFRSIDTGMGLERVASVLQGTESVFEIDLFEPALEHLRELTSWAQGEEELHPLRKQARKIIVDHTRAALFAGLAGVGPGNIGRNSVVRRLIRRASRQGRILGIDKPFLGEIVTAIAGAHEGLLRAEETKLVPEIARELATEEERFARVLTVGLKELAKLQPDEHGVIPGKSLFQLHAEKGFPADLAAEVLVDRGLSVDWSSYESALTDHQTVSRLSAERRFKSS